MKKILLFICSLMSLQAFAQDPIKWKADIQKTDSGNIFVITALMEQGWHVFANDAGGDGLAIGTEITVETSDAKNKKSTPIIVKDKDATTKPVDKDMPGFGVVHYFENDVQYKIFLGKNNATLASAKIYFQACNDNMCLPPKELVVKATIK